MNLSAAQHVCSVPFQCTLVFCTHLIAKHPCCEYQIFDESLESVLQAQACLKLLPSSPSAAAELAFIQGIERLKDYDITLSPLQCLQVWWPS
jgi:hypothetical protein